jgi:hypothetical protein
MTDRPDAAPGFLAATFATAVATGLYFFFCQPLSGAGAPRFHADNVTLAGFDSLPLCSLRRCISPFSPRPCTHC